MRIEQKVGFLDGVIDVIIRIIFYFQVALQNPVALSIFSLILIVGLYIGIKQVFFHKDRKAWTENQKKDLKITIVLFVLIVILFILSIKFIKGNNIL